MRVTKLTFVILFIIVNCNLLSAQEYFTKILDLSTYDAVRHAIFFNDNIMLNNTVSDGSSLILLDKTLELQDIKVYPDVLLNFDSPVKVQNRVYGYAIDLKKQNQHLMLTLDNDLNEIKRDSFYSNGDESNVISMTKINNMLVGTSWDQYDCPERCTEMNYKVIDTLGIELSSWNIDPEEEYFFSFRVETTSDNHLIVGGNRFQNGARGTIYKMDLEGNIIWTYKDYEIQARGNTIVRAIELSNGNITYIDYLDYSNDLEYLARGNTIRPSKFTILTPEGNELYTFIDSIDIYSNMEYMNIIKGNGDYFFICGEHRKNSADSDPFDGNYGFIMKVTNDGEKLWHRNYNYTSNENDAHIIRFILEDDFGDIYTIGLFSTGISVPIWMMKLNEHGCMGGDDCGEFIIHDPVSTDNLHNDSSIMIYPNPTRESLFIEGIEIDRYTIFNTSGMIMEEESRIENATIDVSKLDVGLYFLQLIDKEGKSVVRKFLVE